MSILNMYPSTQTTESKTMSNAIDYLFSLSLTILGLVMVFIVLGEGNQSHIIAGWLVTSLGIFRGVMSEIFQH